MYKLFGIAGNSEELKDKIDRKIDKLKNKAIIKNDIIDITQFVDAYSLEESTHYTCYLNIRSKCMRGRIKIPITSKCYSDKLEDDPKVIQMKNNDCANTYAIALDLARKFTDSGLEVMVDSKTLEDIKTIIPKLKSGEVNQTTFIIPSY
jgi:hypothetical protein